MVLAADGRPGWWTVLWVTAAMAGGRTCAMAANRVIDRVIDAENPRTAGRHLPRGVLRTGELATLAAAGAALMFVAAWMLNPLCLMLAPLALVFLVGYSYTKYFTWTSHWILGFTDGIGQPLAEKVDQCGAAVQFRLAVPLPGRLLRRQAFRHRRGVSVRVGFERRRLRCGLPAP